jgi:hypothetical protein
MARTEDAGRFIRVGRIEIGPTRVEPSTPPGTGVRVRIPWRDPRGKPAELEGAGPDLATAVADGLTSLSRTPFTVEAITHAPRPAKQGRAAVCVLVRDLADGGGKPATGHAVADDEATAVTNATLRGLAAAGFLQMRLLPAGARDVEASTSRIVAGLRTVLSGSGLTPEQIGSVRELVARELHRFGAAQAIVAAHAADPAGVLTRFDAQAALAADEGEPKTSDTRTGDWWEWFPGLDNDDRTLRDVLSELPAAPATAIPWIVRLFENPQGWLRLHGAVHLRNHDMIHVLLGRGLLDQDEAFVIGFTMGSTKAVSRLERWFFTFAVSRLYPEPYRIAGAALASYDLGLEAGREFGVKNLHLRLRDEMLDRPLGEIRRELRIDTRRLREFYARERAAVPGTLASLRLPAVE